MITGIRLLDRMNAAKNPLIRIEVWFTDAEHLSKEDKAVLNGPEFKGDYKKLVNVLLENIERAMCTRLSGDVDPHMKFWDTVEPSFHNTKK